MSDTSNMATVQKTNTKYPSAGGGGGLVKKNDPFTESLQEDNVLDERLFILSCKSNLNSRSRHELY